MENNYGVPYIPESQVELDSQLLRTDTRTSFKNKQLSKLLNDDSVRSYLNDYEIKALQHYAASYTALCDANQGKYDGVFDNAAEMVLAELNFLINIARSREGINVRTVKGRGPLEEFKPKSIIDRFKPVPQSPQQQQQQDQFQPNYGPQYDYPRR